MKKQKVKKTKKNSVAEAKKKAVLNSVKGTKDEILVKAILKSGKLEFC